jgi:uncharacterized peroxidase-related enzyme
MAARKAGAKKAARTTKTTGEKIHALGIKAPPRSALDPGIQKYFGKCDEKLGFVPNVLLAYSFDHAKLNGFITMYNELMLGESGVSKLEREMIAVAVSSINHCYYCIVAHGAAVRELSGNPVLGEQIVANWRSADLTEKQRAMLDFATIMTEAPDTVDEEDRQSLRDAGWSERDIWDIAATAAFFNMSNRMAIAVDMRPNPEYHKQFR